MKMNFAFYFACTFLWLFAGQAVSNPSAEKGYSFLVNGGYVGCGVPVSVMKRAVASKSLIPPSLVSTFVPMAAEEIFGSKVELPGRNSDNANVTPVMNVFTSKRGGKVMNFNCLSCHGEYLNGEFVVGLGNRTRDFTQDISRFTRALPLLAWTGSEREELRFFSRAAEAIAPYTQTKTVGVNPAINLTYALFAHRNREDFSWSDRLTLDPPSVNFAPVDVPPWWRMGRKQSMFYSGEFRDNHHRIMSLASTLCIDDGQDLVALEAPFYDVEAFINTLKAPRYPGPTKPDLVGQGQEIFNNTCSRCHGTYGEQGRYDELFIPVGVVGTDPLLAQSQIQESERFAEWYADASFNVYGTAVLPKGSMSYLAPPLDGIWATAPYLHNGSVPNLDSLLNSSQRPTYWKKLNPGKVGDYDWMRPGVRFEAIKHGQGKANLVTRRHIYDTTLPGYGNQGHEFGDHLSDDERLAVIEYLKTL